jgi:hypothetical protein
MRNEARTCDNCGQPTGHRLRVFCDDKPECQEARLEQRRQTKRSYRAKREAAEPQAAKPKDWGRSGKRGQAGEEGALTRASARASEATVVIRERLEELRTEEFERMAAFRDGRDTEGQGALARERA